MNPRFRSVGAENPGNPAHRCPKPSRVSDETSPRALPCGIKIGDSLDELRQAKKELKQTGISFDGMSDHTVSQSLYLKDPDRNEVEVYVDADEPVWKKNPAAAVPPIKSLNL